MIALLTAAVALTHRTPQHVSRSVAVDREYSAIYGIPTICGIIVLLYALNLMAHSTAEVAFAAYRVQSEHGLKKLRVVHDNEESVLDSELSSMEAGGIDTLATIKKFMWSS